MGRPLVITPAALSVLLAHDWPGNVRELRNICERASVLTETPEITEATIIQALGPTSPKRPAIAASPAQMPRLNGTIRDLNANAIENALAASNGNKTEAAKMLGIGRSTLWRFLRDASPGP